MITPKQLSKIVGIFVATVAFVGLIFMNFVSPVVVFAQPTANGGVGSADPKDQDTTRVPDKNKFQLVSCQGVNDPRTPSITEVECDYNQMIKTVDRIIQFVLWLLTPIVIGMMMFTGFKYITAGGDANLIADAKRMFTPILIGMFFIFAGWLLVYTVLDKLLADDAGGVPKGSVLPANIRS